MVTSVPAWFGRKALEKPPGLDLTFITKGETPGYTNFIGEESTFVNIEQRIISEQIGTRADTPNRYSYGGGAKVQAGTGSTGDAPEYDVQVSGISQRWGLGSNFLANNIIVPNNYSTSGDGVVKAANQFSNIDREYNPLNRSIFITASLSQSDLFNNDFVTDPVYPYTYIGLHSISMFVRESPEIPLPDWLQPPTNWEVKGLVYTTDQQGVAIYFDFSNAPTTIGARTRSVPTSAMVANAAASSTGGRTQPQLLFQAVQTNGALFDLESFSSEAELQSLGNMLGMTLGKFLWAVPETSIEQ